MKNVEMIVISTAMKIPGSADNVSVKSPTPRIEYSVM